MEFYFTYKHEYNAICCWWMTLSCFTYRFRAHSLFIYVCYISVAAEENLQKQMQGQRLNIFIVSLPWNFIKQIKLIKKYVVPVTKYTMWILFFPDKLDKEYKMQRQKKVIRVDKVMQKHIFQNVRNPLDEKKNEKHFFRNDDKPNIKWFDNKFNINFPTSNHLHRPFHIRRAPIPSIGVPWPKPQKIRSSSDSLYRIKTLSAKTNLTKCDLLSKAVKRYRDLFFTCHNEHFINNLLNVHNANFTFPIQKPSLEYLMSQPDISRLYLLVMTCPSYPTISSDESCKYVFSLIYFLLYSWYE